MGIDWRALRGSAFSSAVLAELGDEGLGLPALDCIDQANQILVSSPALLVVVSGTFDAKIVGQQAIANSLRPFTYKNINLWLAPQSAALGIALVSPQIMLVGSSKTLQASIDRSADLATQEGETARASVRRYSPLLARAAQFAHNADLWVVSTRLPDPLASRFVPLEVEAVGFEGFVSVQDGLRMDSIFSTSSGEEALVMAEHMRGSFASLPSLARGIEVHVEGSQVELSLVATAEQFAASIDAPPPAVPQPAVIVAATPVAVAAPVAAVPAPPLQESKPAQPQVIRIVGLDDGPKEIPFPDPPAK